MRLNNGVHQIRRHHGKASCSAVNSLVRLRGGTSDEENASLIPVKERSREKLGVIVWPGQREESGGGRECLDNRSRCRIGRADVAVVRVPATQEIKAIVILLLLDECICISS